MQSALAYNAYVANCGRGEGVTGDGVCPVDCAYVPGARHIELLGVAHLPGRGRRVPDLCPWCWQGPLPVDFTSSRWEVLTAVWPCRLEQRSGPRVLWYGDREAIDLWDEYTFS